MDTDWSVRGGTLTLAGVAYLKASARVGGSLALVGTWMGMDDVFETLVFNDNGAVERHHDAEGTVTETFQVQGNSLTVRLAGAAATSATWSVRDGILTINSSVGTVKQYARSG